MNIFTMYKDIIFFLNRNEFVTVLSNECLSVTQDKKMKMLISLIKMIIQVLPSVLSLYKLYINDGSKNISMDHS